jgi:hypothetical protein
MAIHKHVEKKLNTETYILIGGMCLGVILGWAQLGGLGAFLGFVGGIIVARIVTKVAGWFN